MKYRKLRIAWSVLCGILCLLLIALWVRSYWRIDAFTRAENYGPTTMVFMHNGRVLTLRAFNLPIGQDPDTMAHGWKYSQMPAYPGRDVDRWLGPGCTITIKPLWPRAALLAALSAAPFIRLPRRFSLRTMLIGVTLVAVILGLVIWAAK